MHILDINGYVKHVNAQHFMRAEFLHEQKFSFTTGDYVKLLFVLFSIILELLGMMLSFTYNTLWKPPRVYINNKCLKDQTCEDVHRPAQPGIDKPQAFM